MRTSIKVLLIVLAIVGAVCSVLYYLKSQVEPPKAIKEENYAYHTIEQALDIDWELDNLEELQRQYNVQSDLIERLHEDAHLKDDKRDEFVDKLYELYGTQVIEKYYSTVSKEWRKSNLDALAPYITNLEQVTDLQDTLLRSNHSEIDKGIGDFRSMQQNLNSAFWEVGQPFSSVEASRAALKKRNELKADSVLNKCTDLMEAVNQQPDKLNKGHYHYLEEKVERLAKYQEMNRDEYNQAVDDAKKQIKTYQSEAKKLYGAEKDLSSLTKRRDEYISQAQQYY